MAGLVLVESAKAPESSLVGKVFIKVSNASIPVLSKLFRILLGSDVYCHLPPSTILPHPYGIVINHRARIGRHVIILHQVTIGVAHYTKVAAPRIEDEVYIGAGAKILGDITVGRGAMVGANAVVTSDVPAGGAAVGFNIIRAAPPDDVVP